MSDEAPPSPKQLRNIAWTLDRLTELTLCLLEPLASMKRMNAESAQVTVELTNDGKPMTQADARRLLVWVRGDEMQADLRAWADSLEDDDDDDEWGDDDGE